MTGRAKSALFVGACIAGLTIMAGCREDSKQVPQANPTIHAATPAETPAPDVLGEWQGQLRVAIRRMDELYARQSALEMALLRESRRICEDAPDTHDTCIESLPQYADWQAAAKEWEGYVDATLFELEREAPHPDLGLHVAIARRDILDYGKQQMWGVWPTGMAIKMARIDQIRAVGPSHPEYEASLEESRTLGKELSRRNKEAELRLLSLAEDAP
ncbi:MAG: hypothetical protein C3F10_15870 [Dehalococcoidia bacterium]|nr:MAG: hypothetical protein C3F10_15870 [Dehalococcoidia bacterium]